MHFRSAASQQVNESSIEGHDGISQMNSALLMLLFSAKPDKISRDTKGAYSRLYSVSVFFLIV